MHNTRYAGASKPGSYPVRDTVAGPVCAMPTIDQVRTRMFFAPSDSQNSAVRLKLRGLSCDGKPLSSLLRQRKLDDIRIVDVPELSNT